MESTPSHHPFLDGMFHYKPTSYWMEDPHFRKPAYLPPPKKSLPHRWDLNPPAWALQVKLHLTMKHDHICEAELNFFFVPTMAFLCSLRRAHAPPQVSKNHQKSRGTRIYLDLPFTSIYHLRRFTIILPPNLPSIYPQYPIKWWSMGMIHDDTSFRVEFGSSMKIQETTEFGTITHRIHVWYYYP